MDNIINFIGKAFFDILTVITVTFVTVLTYFCAGWLLSLAFADLLNPFTSLFLGADVVQFTTVFGFAYSLFYKLVKVVKTKRIM